MISKPQAIIDYAVRICLDKCARTDMPMTCLSDYVTQLKEAGWDESSLDEFQHAVLAALANSSSMAATRPVEP
jgi:hypothetical protein